MLQNEGREIDWEALRKEPLVVPDSATLPQLLRHFQESQRHLAIVVDEYGSVEGIVALEDVLEEIVGDIRDETDVVVEDFEEDGAGVLVVRGDVDMRKLSTKLGIAWDPELGVATVGGLVTETLERIPKAGESIVWNGYRIEVLDANRRRARLLGIRKEAVS